MAQKTKIQWCDSAVNPAVGRDGCELWKPEDGVTHCYTGTLHMMRAGKVKGYAQDFNVPEMFAGRMAAAARWSDLTGKERPDKPWLNGMPRLISVSDMGDALSVSVPFSYLRDEIIANVTNHYGRRHIWMCLTKGPERMAEFAEWLAAQNYFWPDNLWAGTSITSQCQMERWRHLRRVPAKVRFLSCEPLLGPLKLPIDEMQNYCSYCDKWSVIVDDNGRHRCSTVPQQTWVILGGESGKEARPCEVEWIRSGIEQCQAGHIPVFVKQLGSKPMWCAAPLPSPGQSIESMLIHGEYDPDPMPLNLRDRHGGDWSEWPEWARVREMPRVAVRP